MRRVLFGLFAAGCAVFMIKMQGEGPTWVSSWLYLTKQEWAIVGLSMLAGIQFGFINDQLDGLSVRIEKLRSKIYNDDL